MKYKHQVSIVNKADKKSKILWSDEYDNFDFKRLNYELHRYSSSDLKNQDLYIGIIQFNGHEWILGTNQNIILPSGEEMFFLDKWVLSPVELAYLMEHSKEYLNINEKMGYSNAHIKAKTLTENTDINYKNENPIYRFLYDKVNEDNFRFGLLKSQKYNSELKKTFEFTEIADIEFGTIKPDNYLILLSEYTNSDPENPFTEDPEYSGTDMLLTITSASEAYSEIGEAYLNNLPLNYIGLIKFENKSDAITYLNDSIKIFKSERWFK